MKQNKDLFAQTAPQIINFALGNGVLRKLAAKYAKRYVFRQIVEHDRAYTLNIRREKYVIAANLIDTLERALTNRNISASVRKKLIEVLVGNILLKNKPGRTDDFVTEFGQDPPGFITISPGRQCNLRCTGCYAGSEAKSNEKLDYSTVDRIVREKTELWNSPFTVISGGEPLLWRSNGKGILDLCRDHPENYFMMYTNGTLIHKKMAEAIAEVGNLSPAISVEGFEAQTDERRGNGVFGRALEAMAALREVGVPFGISVTATKHNATEILSDEFIDFFFEQQGAIYGWIFQYMPIGRHHTLELMVTPEQRKWMFEREQYLIHDKHIFLPDFWNGGVYSNGCLAAGRAGGYLYIDWNGNVAPCVFYPYSKTNIKEVYAGGGNLNDVLRSDLMVGIRNWQRDYGFEKSGKEVHNFIAPCSIRDHFEFTHGHIERTGARPTDPDAADALDDPLYFKGMVRYGRKFMALTERLWKREFIGVAGEDGARKAPLSTQSKDTTKETEKSKHSIPA